MTESELRSRAITRLGATIALKMTLSELTEWYKWYSKWIDSNQTGGIFGGTLVGILPTLNSGIGLWAQRTQICKLNFHILFGVSFGTSIRYTLVWRPEIMNCINGKRGGTDEHSTLARHRSSRGY